MLRWYYDWGAAVQAQPGATVLICDRCATTVGLDKRDIAAERGYDDCPYCKLCGRFFPRDPHDSWSRDLSDEAW